MGSLEKTAVLTTLSMVLLGGSNPAMGRQAETALELWSVVSSSARRTADPLPAIVRASRIELDAATLADGAAAERLALPTLDGKAWQANRIFSEDRGKGDFVWRGSLRGDPDGLTSVTLTVRRGRMSGLIVGPSSVYQIVPFGPEAHLLAEIDPSLFPECGGAVEPEISANEDLRQASAITPGAAGGGIVTVEVMALYTPQARDAAGGVANIEATVQSAVDITNTAFTGSSSNARFHLAYTGLANHDDAGDTSADLSWVRYDATVAGLRNTHAADLVSLIVENGAGVCGRGYVMRNVGPGFASSAFQVTDRGCAVGNLTWAHEHGHNLGLEHDPANGTSPASASYPWSFGHYVNGSYRTVMSYSNQCASGCTRVARFSNPDVVYNSSATGIADERDNHRTLDEGDSGVGTAEVAAAFRGSAADDAYEENDSRATAYDLSGDEQTWLSAMDGAGVQADDDWFEIQATSGYTRIVVDLQFSDAAGDIDLALHDSGGGLLASSTSVTDDESIDFVVPAAGQYFLRIYYDDAGNSYDLWWDDLQPPTAPDLVVVSPSADPAALATGEAFTVGATVQNSGDGAAASTTLSYYRSTDATMTTGDTLLGSDPIPALGAGGSSAQSLGTVAPGGAGSYWVGACVVAVAGETSTLNNCSTGVPIEVVVGCTVDCPIFSDGFESGDHSAWIFGEEDL
jgi:hypothetical protein